MTSVDQEFKMKWCNLVLVILNAIHVSCNGAKTKAAIQQLFKLFNVTNAPFFKMDVTTLLKNLCYVVQL